MRVIENILPTELEKVEIVPFFDLHIGSNKCDMLKLQKDIEYVKNNAHVYCVLGGDIVNNSIIGSVAQCDLYENPLPPMEQIKLAAKLFEPIKDKILCVTAGNHERRSMKSAGIDLIEHLCLLLGIVDKYDYVSCVCLVRFGKLKSGNSVRDGKKISLPHGKLVTYSLYVSHGDGIGGRLMGSKINGLEKRARIVDADIVLTGHTHQPAELPKSFFRIDYHNKQVLEHEQWLVSAGSYLSYEAYAEMYGAEPTSRRNPRIYLSGTTKYINTDYADHELERI